MRIHRHRQHRPKYKVQQYKVNERIKSPKVKVINEENEMLGEMDTEAAIAMAKAKELDLVEVSPKADPPVCRILDYGQFKYQKEKEAKKQKAQSKEVDIKGIRLTFRMGVGDQKTRLAQAIKFLEKGDKIKIDLALRGREKAHKTIAKEKIDEFINQIKETYPIRVEQAVQFQAGRMTAIVARE